MKKTLLISCTICALTASIVLGCGPTAAEIQAKKTADSIAEVKQRLEQAETRRLDSIKYETWRITDSINESRRVELIKNSIKITSYYLSRPNSASGVDAYFYYKNLSNQTIKYLSWLGHPINAVGDTVECTIRDTSTSGGKSTGPIRKNQTGGGCWECLWCNWSAKKLILSGVYIEKLSKNN